MLFSSNMKNRHLARKQVGNHHFHQKKHPENLGKILLPSPQNSILQKIQNAKHKAGYPPQHPPKREKKEGESPPRENSRRKLASPTPFFNGG